MNLSGRRVARMLTGIGIFGGVCAHLCNAPVARADIGGPIIPSNAANPFVIACTDTTSGFCLYATAEAGIAGTTDNPYPSYAILGFFSTDGRTWSARGSFGGPGMVFQESQLYVAQPHGFVTSPNHLGAPSVAIGNDNKYYLYVSDVVDGSSTGVHTTRQTAVARSDTPFGPFTVIGRVHWSETGVDSGAQYVDYARVVQDTGGRSLTWSDGDSTNCGGMAIAQLSDDMMALSGLTYHTINIGGTTPLGACSGGTHPFSEAPTLIQQDSLIRGASTLLPGPYILLFSAKPQVTPNECTSDKGQPGTNLEVVAYATATSPTGPFTYRGILNCGSSTEKSNHATFGLMRAVGGGLRVVMIYDDGPGGSLPQRKLHAECLYHGASSFAGIVRSTTAYTECMNQVDGKNIVLRSRQNGGIVSAPNSGAQLITNRWAAGPWERFDAFDGNGVLTNVLANHITLRARSNSKFVCADTGTGHPVRANKTSSSDLCVDLIGDTHAQTDSSETLTSNQYFCLVNVGTGTTGPVSCSGTTENNSTKFDQLRLGFPD